MDAHDKPAALGQQLELATRFPSAVLTTRKLNFCAGTSILAPSSQVICRNTPVLGPPL
jgi:hypothetical protein